ncbi:MAG TPA: hypothetical protein DFR83_22175 [Deltaproteobacteria bacterium]|nr:hypothetical protein [Deltaproteobacteria bacterium]
MVYTPTMQNPSWQRRVRLSAGFVLLNASILGLLWLVPMPPEQLPNTPPATPSHPPTGEHSHETEASIYGASDLMLLDAALEGRLAQVAEAQGVSLATVAPDPALREAAFAAVDPEGEAARALLEAYAAAFAVLDPNPTP